ncbi:hypothetical protein [Nocardia sp. NPDC127526]|uniref:hypothetical protein n=1 Tax=Nocardia sp. NPDC127526 TaxID=3345393 RepID=UPI00363D8904
MPWGRHKNEPPFPFLVDDITREAFGSAGLRGLATNLWPHECQTCGREFVGARPAVHVEVRESGGTATLHHADCHPAGWDELATTSGRESSSTATLSTISCALLLPTVGEQTGVESWRPFLLVNPGLEQVAVVKDDGHWRVATVDYYAQFGLNTGGEVLRLGDGIPNAIASLDDRGTITVMLGDLRAGFAAECEPEVVDRIRELGGIVLVLGSVLRPDHDTLDLVHEFADAIQARQVAGGWVPLG